MNTKNYIRLPLKNAYNVRDLGGYACGDDTATKWRAFLRADDLSNLNAEEIQFLIGYGVNCVIDLRSTEECDSQLNPFKNIEGVDYINIPIMTNVITDVTKALEEKPQVFLSNFYVELIKNATSPIKTVFEEIANHIEGCTLFHCAAGKDRTGIIAMLLLGLAGVDIPDTVSNYEITYTYIKQNPIFKDSTVKYPVDMLMSKHEYIEHAINYIMTNYEGIPQYLKHIGLSDEMIAAIQRKICI